MSDLQYSDLQNRAIDSIVEWYGNFDSPQVFYLAGFAGTGKTTVAKEAIARLKHIYDVHDIPIGAYTGKAAHVLRKKGNPSAMTIHSMIYIPEEVPVQIETPSGPKWTTELRFILNIVGPAAMADLILLDECSMINVEMANDLLSFGKKILVMGDPGQLPPVSGEGHFTGRKPDFFLNEIHRQAAESPIIELATMARQGIALPIGYKKGNVQVLPLTNATADEYLHKPDTQVLCGLNRVRWSVTQIMREKLGFFERFPTPGERILCCKNDNKKGLFNGGEGTLSKLDIKSHEVWRISAEVEGRVYDKMNTDSFLFRQHFDDSLVRKSYHKAMEFDWGYVWSVHKAQGSGWPSVTLIDNSTSFRENRWKHLYTGLTRAEEQLTVLV